MSGGTTGRSRGQLPTAAVATMAATFGTSLLQVTGMLAASIRADPTTGASQHTVPALLNATAIVFIVIAIYVSAVVTTNTVSTVVAGRTRQIALLRLIGSSARAERARIAREGLVVGVIGALAGVLLGTAVAQLFGRVAQARQLLPAFDYDVVDPIVALPLVAVALTTWFAAWIGSGRVLAVRPMQALGNAVEADREEVEGQRGRRVAALILVIVGAVLLALGVVAGLASPLGVLVGVIGGIVSFSGIVLAATAVIPPVLRIVGRVFGPDRVARLAAENAVRHPERSARMTVGLVIGVTLVTTFAVAMQSFLDLALKLQQLNPDEYAGTADIINGITTVFSVLIGFSALIAAVGLVNVLSLNVLQRTRELGLMRALGFDRMQLRMMILTEAAALTLTAVAIGLLLGFVYGWIGAQSLLGMQDGHPRLVVPGIPWPVIAVIAGSAALLTLIAAIAPARRATRISPVVALAVE